MSSDTCSRLCPEHQNDSTPTLCGACVQARRIAELEQAVERLTVHIEALEADRTADVTREELIAIDGLGEKPVLTISWPTSANAQEVHDAS